MDREIVQVEDRQRHAGEEIQDRSSSARTRKASNRRRFLRKPESLKRRITAGCPSVAGPEFLLGMQLPVQALVGDDLLVRAAGDQAALVEHRDQIGVARSTGENTSHAYLPSASVLTTPILTAVTERSDDHSGARPDPVRTK